MRLRTQLALFLFLFGFTPLIVALAINMPLVFEQLQLFYHKAYLTSLRADFNDLDQHLASRKEMVRLLAKLPEPGSIVIDEQEYPEQVPIEQARARYTDWINLMLSDQPDIIQILFVDQQGTPLFWLERDPRTLELKPVSTLRDLPEKKYLEAAVHLPPGGVYSSPIIIDTSSGTPTGRGRMMLRLVSPIYPPANEGAASPPEPLGAVVINVDVGGLAQIYRNTYWVLNDGRYLSSSLRSGAGKNAFEDFSGLYELFSQRTLALWEGPGGQQVIWVPLFATEQGMPLWVGRRVDPSPIERVGLTIAFRVGLVVLGLLVIIWLIAIRLGSRADRLRADLTEGLRRVVSDAEPVTFDWNGPQELRALGDTLTRLAHSNARNFEALRAHARELEESNRYKSEFLANISHELRTPLNSILLLSKLLAEGQDGQLSAEQRRQAEVIHTAGSDLMAMIDNILELSRIDAHKVVPHPQNVSLPALLDDLVELFQPQFDQRGLELKLVVDADAPAEIRTDGEKVSQILRNFLSNAVKFTLHGGVTLRLARNHGAGPEDRPVRISVSDTGIGIPADKQGFVFEAFEQADGSTRRRFGGTGLGLTISRELARLLKGRIELESEEGTGSTFSLSLPLVLDTGETAPEAMDDIPVRPRPERPPPADLPDTGVAGRHTVLVLEPDLDALLQLTPALERCGLRVTAAADLGEAAEAVDGGDTFDLVMVDIMAGNMDAANTIGTIRSLPSLGTVPVLATGVGAGSALWPQWRQAGAEDIVPLPVDAGTLGPLLGRYLGTAGCDTRGT